jgi:hypothetical protein
VPKSIFIEELVREGDRWRMSIGEVGSADELWREMYPAATTAPHGVTIEEEMIQHEPRMIGHFFIGGITEDAVSAMEEGFAEAFRAAGFSGGPAEGMVRTWMQGVEEPWDLPEQEASELYCDNFADVELPNLGEMTIWDPVQDQTCEFRYTNGKTFSVRLGDIQQDDAPASFLWNDSNYLIVPVNESWQPVLNARTTTNMFQFRYGLEQADREIREQQLEIGFMARQFAGAVARLAKGSQVSNPLNALRGRR